MSDDEPVAGLPQLSLAGFDDVGVEPDRDAWTTPEKITSIIGRFDLDPCSNKYSTVDAEKTFDLERGQNGLVLARFVARHTKTWINPPYSRGQVIQWVRAYRHTRFAFLVRADVSTDWWAELWPSVAALCLPKDRVAFKPPPGIKDPPGSPFPHAFLFARADDVTPELAAASYVLVKAAACR